MFLWVFFAFFFFFLAYGTLKPLYYTAEITGNDYMASYCVVNCLLGYSQGSRLCFRGVGKQFIFIYVYIFILCIYSIQYMCIQLHKSEEKIN